MFATEAQEAVWYEETSDLGEAVEICEGRGGSVAEEGEDWVLMRFGDGSGLRIGPGLRLHVRCASVTQPEAQMIVAQFGNDGACFEDAEGNSIEDVCDSECSSRTRTGTDTMKNATQIIDAAQKIENPIVEATWLSADGWDVCLYDGADADPYERALGATDEDLEELEAAGLDVDRR